MRCQGALLLSLFDISAIGSVAEGDEVDDDAVALVGSGEAGRGGGGGGGRRWSYGGLSRRCGGGRGHGLDGFFGVELSIAPFVIWDGAGIRIVVGGVAENFLDLIFGQVGILLKHQC